jgi:hypothetical protein
VAKKELSRYDILRIVDGKSKTIETAANLMYSQGIRVNPLNVTRTVMKKLGIPEKHFLDTADAVRDLLKRRGWVREDIWGS